VPDRTSRGRSDIARNGLIVAAKRRESSIAAIRHAIEAIEKETTKNGGIYPFNDGCVNVQEVLRRAKRSPAFLEKAVNRQLKIQVKTRVAEINGKIVTGADNIRCEITARVSDADGRVKKIMQGWTEVELELRRLRQENARLKEENAVMLSRLSGGRVTMLRVKR
jgi:hypothetical protein